MRTSIPKQSIFKPGKVLYTIIGFFFSVLVLTSCSDSDGMNSLEIDDTALIDEIESATRVSVASTSLPSATETALRGGFADSYIVEVELAKDLGYKVLLETDNESRVEAKGEVYFSTKGKLLKDLKEKRIRKRYKCFQFVFPIDFIMPDATSITLNSKDEWIMIKDWYVANKGVKKRPELVFPVDITIEDGTLQTLIDRGDLRRMKDSCKKGKDKRKCFKLILPVVYTMQDGTVIEVKERADFKLLRAWHKANPTVKEKAVLNFPIDIEYKDGTSATINDQKAFEAAKDAC